MKTRIDKHQFGPWAILAGASSGSQSLRLSS